MIASVRRAGQQHGASRLELAVAMLLVSIFVAVLLDRALYYQEFAEMTAMEMTVANMRSGLRYKVADLIINNRVPEIAALADENPMTWLASPPDNYLGEYDKAPQTAIEGNWYYDRTDHELVYTLNKRRHFVPSSGEEFTVRYRAVRVQGAPEGQTKDSRPQTWVTLTQIQGYTWMH
jgi:hypothetical protein